jgi:Na+/H+-dicarboxylate symporter
MFGNPTLYYDIQAVSCFFRVFEQYSLCVEIQPKQVTFLNHSQPNDFFDILLLSCIVEFLGLAFRAWDKEIKQINSDFNSISAQSWSIQSIVHFLQSAIVFVLVFPYFQNIGFSVFSTTCQYCVCFLVLKFSSTELDSHFLDQKSTIDSYFQ